MLKAAPVGLLVKEKKKKLRSPLGTYQYNANNLMPKRLKRLMPISVF